MATNESIDKWISYEMIFKKKELIHNGEHNIQISRSVRS